MFERAEGYNAATGYDAYTNATPVAKVLAAIRAATGSVVANPPKSVFPIVTAPGGIRIGAPPPGTPPSGMHANPLQFLPPNAEPLHDRPAVVGGHGGFNANVTNTNNVTVSAPDPQSAAAMVGLHLDRSGNDLMRSLQGSFQ
jgi:hypothetical protein